MRHLVDLQERERACKKSRWGLIRLEIVQDQNSPLHGHTAGIIAYRLRVWSHRTPSNELPSKAIVHTSQIGADGNALCNTRCDATETRMRRGTRPWRSRWTIGTKRSCECHHQWEGWDLRRSCQMYVSRVRGASLCFMCIMIFTKLLQPELAFG